MKITIKNYPATFSFETDLKLPKFNSRSGCGLRDDILLEKLYEYQINSPNHIYEDYVVEQVIKTKEGEEWHLGS